MNSLIDTSALLAPIAGDNPAGENLRYTPVYDEIQEARKADDPHDRGEWQRDLKVSNWPKVISISMEALQSKTKDLQIAAWLAEAWVHTKGFAGFCAGLRVINGLLRDYWETVYPEIEDGDLDFRAGPIEFMNDKLWVAIKEIPLTDNKVSAGYSWLKWQESREVGYDADTVNEYGDVEEKKRATRNDMISAGKLPAEDFDVALAQSSRTFYETLGADVAACGDEFRKLDKIVDEKFGSSAPRLAEIREALEACGQFVNKVLKEKREAEPDPIGERSESSEMQDKEGFLAEDGEKAFQTETEQISPNANVMMAASHVEGRDDGEQAAWKNGLEKLRTSGLESALSYLFSVSCVAPSAREKNRYRLLMAKLCLVAERPDLARPIIEQLYSLIEELNLERWEPSTWIAEVLDTLYRCLISGERSDEDLLRARDLLRKLCTTDVTKAISHGK